MYIEFDRNEIVCSWLIGFHLLLSNNIFIRFLFISDKIIHLFILDKIIHFFCFFPNLVGI